jgi:hypothetical protein
MRGFGRIRQSSENWLLAQFSEFRPTQGHHCIPQGNNATQSTY